VGWRGGKDSNAVEHFHGYIGVEVQITTSLQYFLGHTFGRLS